MKKIPKLVIVGEPFTGKTSIRKRYMGRGFSTNYLPTMGTDFAIVNLSSTAQKMRMQIWDLAGQDSFELIIPRFISHSKGAFFVFDVSRRETFDKLTCWIKKFRDSNQTHFNNVPLFIIGNKSDLHIKEVTVQEVLQYRISLISKLNLKPDLISCYFTSALTGENIKLIFTDLVSLLRNPFPGICSCQ